MADISICQAAARNCVEVTTLLNHPNIIRRFILPIEETVFGESVNAQLQKVYEKVRVEKIFHILIWPWDRELGDLVSF